MEIKVRENTVRYSKDKGSIQVTLPPLWLSNADVQDGDTISFYIDQANQLIVRKENGTSDTE